VSVYVDLKSLSMRGVSPGGRLSIVQSSRDRTRVWYFLLVSLKYVGSCLSSRVSSAAQRLVLSS
jgi:hypothetical protein